MGIFLSVKRWGNSVGLLLPAGLKYEEGDSVEVDIRKVNRTVKVKEVFGLFSTTNANVNRLMDDVDRDFWGKS